jgi:hypothetical protein
MGQAHGYGGSYSKVAAKRLAEKKPQVPPLRFAPVGMTILLCAQELQLEILALHDRIVIPTGAYPDFLLRAASDVHVYGSP